MAYGDKTNCKACGREIIQISGGHRQRAYCDDNCKQAAFRERREQQHREEVNRRWEAFTPETRSFLDWIMSRYSEDLTTAVEASINREVDQAIKRYQPGELRLYDDTSAWPLKSWLRSRLKQAKRDAIDILVGRILQDSRLPARGSKGLYLAHLRSKGYSRDDIKLFDLAWQEMRDQDNQ